MPNPFAFLEEIREMNDILTEKLDAIVERLDKLIELTDFYGDGK